MQKILVVGSINIDLVSIVENLPSPGETVRGCSFQVYPGGKGANQAVAAAKLGDSVSFLGKTGDDTYAEIALNAMQKAGVDISHIGKETNMNTGIAVIHVSSVSGENCIVHTPGANEKVDIRYIEENIQLIKACDILMVQLELPVDTVEYAMSTACNFGKTVILDPAPAACMKDDLFQYATIITPNETELKNMAQGREGLKAFAYLKAKGAKTVINKAGKDGAYYEREGRLLHIPGFKVKAIDSTAAGDSFNAGLACKLSQGAPLDEAIIFANAVGAISVTKSGAQSAMPDLATVEEFLRLNQIDLKI